MSDICHDPYDAFAERYDLFFRETEGQAQDYAEFFRSLFEENHVHKVLDCACGTGRDVIFVHDLGYEIAGSDASWAMLTRAQANLAARQIDLPVTRADFRQLPFSDRAFDAVLCLRTSLPHMPDERQVRVALNSIRRVLRPGGILILSQGLSDRLVRTKPRFIPVFNTDDVSRVFAIDYGDKTVAINVLDLFHGGGRSEFLVDSFIYLLLLPNDYDRLLRDARFTEVRFLDGHSFRPYSTEHSDQLVVVARR